MPTVEQAIRELRRQILAGLSPENPLPGHLTCTADRVTLSLSLELTDSNATGEPSHFVIAPNPTENQHRVSVEFFLTPALAPLPQILPTALDSPPNADSPNTPVFTALAAIFGAPGFDSSARATVFREILEDLSQIQQQEVLLSLDSSPTPAEDSLLTQARYRILRLAECGPAKGQGPELLRQLAQRETVQTLVLLAAVHWRTQSEWAAESSPYA